MQMRRKSAFSRIPFHTEPIVIDTKGLQELAKTKFAELKTAGTSPEAFVVEDEDQFIDKMKTVLEDMNIRLTKTQYKNILKDLAVLQKVKQRKKNFF